MRPENLKFISSRELHYLGISLLMGGRIDGNRNYSSAEITWKEVENGVPAAPSLHLTEEEAQALLQSLWDIGVRPREVASSGQLSLAENHISDLRKISFDLLDLIKEK